MNRIGAAVAKEIKEAVPPFVFFLLLFHMVALTKSVVLGDSGVGMLRALGATVGALVVAKAILIAAALPVPGPVSGRGSARILYKTALFGLVVLLFKFLEELVPLLREHGGPGAATRAMFQEISWPLFTVVSLWIIGGLLFYNALAELIEGVGRDRAVAILLEKRT